MMQITTALRAWGNHRIFERISLGRHSEEMENGCKNGDEPYLIIWTIIDEKGQKHCFWPFFRHKVLKYCSVEKNAVAVYSRSFARLANSDLSPFSRVM